MLRFWRVLDGRWPLNTPSWSCMLFSHYTWPNLLAKKWLGHYYMWVCRCSVQGSRYRYNRTWFTNNHNSLWKSKSESTGASPTVAVITAPGKKMCPFELVILWFAHRQGLGEISISFVVKRPRLTASCCHIGTHTLGPETQKSSSGFEQQSVPHWYSEPLKRVPFFIESLSRQSVSTMSSLWKKTRKERIEEAQESLDDSGSLSAFFFSTLIANAVIQVVTKKKTFFLFCTFWEIHFVECKGSLCPVKFGLMVGDADYIAAACFLRNLLIGDRVQTWTATKQMLSFYRNWWRVLK